MEFPKTPLRVIRLIGVMGILGVLSPTSAFSEAFRILDQSASATGQGTAFAAQADDASAIHFNPAGMTQLRGIQFSIGTNLIGGHTTFTNSSGTEVTGTLGGAVANPPPSQVYLTASLQDLDIELLKKWTVGIGVTSPFGINIEYPSSAPFASVATSASLPLIDIKPTFAYELNEYISLGAGADIYTFASFLGEGQGEIKCVGCFGFPPGTQVEANGTDTALGFNASFLLTPFRNANGKPLLNVAFVYRSQTDLNLDGKVLQNGAFFANASTTLELPQIITGAIAFWPIRDQDREWKVEVDLDYADWNEFQNLNLRLSNGAVVLIPRNYGDSFVVMVGTEHKWLDMKSLPNWEIALRGGYIRSETPIPSNSFEPAVPDSAYNAISIGLGVLCKDRGTFLGLIPCGSSGAKALGLDLAYQVLLYQARGINNNINPSVNGQWDTLLHVGAMNLRMNF